jgi:hypothetical protein
MNFITKDPDIPARNSNSNRDAQKSYDFILKSCFLALYELYELYELYKLSTQFHSHSSFLFPENKSLYTDNTDKFFRR